ncbi:MAG: hypothetical protein AB1778_06445 [Candidatus Bipolaricaulota bacterium]
MAREHMISLQRVVRVREIIQDLHPFLAKLFPIAIVEDGHFLIYDIGPNDQTYRLVRRAATPMPIPKGVRAAFPLSDYDDRMACVVTGDVFDEPDGYATIFHEFVHCGQAESCEQKLKDRLKLARQAREANDPMWEINHPFPYAAHEFAPLYQAFLDSHSLLDIESIRQDLRSSLERRDYEYMVWQEWKEGFARFIENQIRRRLGLEESHGGKKQPFGRVVFYAGGAHYIETLSGPNPSWIVHIEKLFDRMLVGLAADRDSV